MRIIGINGSPRKQWNTATVLNFDPVHKEQRRREVFPQDCQRAYELGARLVAPE